ncbi:MAG TPA: prolipoprotein diacylglyceryl transferase family protein [Methylomirabilota bacterium]|nr:prolipoprotein diacylglyceryl transferase family protein [Methylomirabilota bacterium]
MHPRLSEYPHISSYSAMLVLGYFLAFLLTRARAKRAGLEPRHIDNLGLMLLLAGVAGARLFSRAFEMPNVQGLDVLKLWEGGGLVFYGGFIASSVVCVTYVLVNRLPFLKALDAFAPGVLVGLSVGRIGCFLAGCCWGDVCLDRAFVERTIQDPQRVFQVQTLPALSPEGFALAVQFPARAEAARQHQRLGLIPAGSARSAPVHASQLYEAALAALAAWLLHVFTKTNQGSGRAAGLLLLSYAIIRFAIEFVRADNSPRYWGMTLSQVVSLFMIGAAFAIALCRMRTVALEARPRLAPETITPR